MKTFTPTEFRQNSSKVFNEVQANGIVFIKSKSRPDMVLMSKGHLDILTSQLEFANKANRKSA